MELLETHNVARGYGDVIATLFTEGEGSQTTDLAILHLSSPILSIVSPVFRAMLDPSRGFLESKVNTENMKEIRILTPSVKTALLAMNILHYQEIPEVLEVQDLYDLATFVDYYQMKDVFQRLTRQSGALLRPARDAWSHTSKRLWIGMVFRSKSIVRDCVQQSFQRMTKKNDSYIVGSTPLHIAMDIYSELIWKEREKYVQKFISEVNSKYEVFRTKFEEKYHIKPTEPSSSKSGQYSPYESSDESSYYDSDSLDVVMKLSPSKCDLVQLGVLNALRLQIGSPEHKLDEVSFNELFSTFITTTRQAEADRNRDCRNSLKNLPWTTHISCDTVEYLYNLAVEIKKTNVHTELIASFNIKDLN
ncbi:hypothetical protein TWF281_001434 [Arthrobotrys megalospora]